MEMKRQDYMAMADVIADVVRAHPACTGPMGQMVRELTVFFMERDETEFPITMFVNACIPARESADISDSTREFPDGKNNI